MKIFFDPHTMYNDQDILDYCAEVVALFRDLGHEVFYAHEVPKETWATKYDEDGMVIPFDTVQNGVDVKSWVNSQIKDADGNVNIDIVFSIIKFNKKNGKKRSCGNLICPQRKGDSWINNKDEMLSQETELIWAFGDHQETYFKSDRRTYNEQHTSS